MRDLDSLYEAVHDAHIIIHAAALKQVPACEYFPEEAALTNITGAINLVKAIKRFGRHVEAVVGISTDKACKPVNVMGMTKSVHKRAWYVRNICFTIFSRTQGLKNHIDCVVQT